jgi:hypothetical protein
MFRTEATDENTILVPLKVASKLAFQPAGTGEPDSPTDLSPTRLRPVRLT